MLEAVGIAERAVEREVLRLQVVADQRRLVLEGPGIEGAPQARDSSDSDLDRGLELPGRQCVRVAVVVVDVLVEEHRGVVAAPGAGLDEAGQAFEDIVLEAQGAVDVVALQPLPGLIGAALRVGRRWQRHAGRQEHAALESADVALQVADVGIEPRPLAAIVQARASAASFSDVWFQTEVCPET